MQAEAHQHGVEWRDSVKVSFHLPSELRQVFVLSGSEFLSLKIWRSYPQGPFQWTLFKILICIKAKINFSFSLLHLGIQLAFIFSVQSNCLPQATWGKDSSGCTTLPQWTVGQRATQCQAGKGFELQSSSCNTEEAIAQTDGCIVCDGRNQNCYAHLQRTVQGSSHKIAERKQTVRWMYTWLSWLVSFQINTTTHSKKRRMVLLMSQNVREPSCLKISHLILIWVQRAGLVKQTLTSASVVRDLVLPLSICPHLARWESLPCIHPDLNSAVILALLHY